MNSAALKNLSKLMEKSVEFVLRASSLQRSFYDAAMLLEKDFDSYIHQEEEMEGELSITIEQFLRHWKNTQWDRLPKKPERDEVARVLKEWVEMRMPDDMGFHIYYEETENWAERAVKKTWGY